MADLIKIYISASNQDYNRYTGQDTNEADQCGIVSDMQAEILRSTGRFEVRVGHGEGMLAKIAEANAWGPALYLCNHTNAGGGHGSRLFYYTEGGQGQQCCKAIAKYLFPLSPGTDDRISRNDLLETREPNAPVAFCEHEFHDNAAGAAWIVASKQAIAEAVAHGVCDHFGVPFPGSQPAPAPAPEPAPETGGKVRHRVIVEAGRVASFADADKAAALLAQLSALGVTARVDTVQL